MPFITRLVSFWRNIFRRSQVERDLDDELRACIDEIAGRNLREGMSAEDAQEAAIHELGGIDGLKQKIRSQHIGRASLQTVVAFGFVAMVFFAVGAATVIGFIRWGNPEWVSKVGVPADVPSTSKVSVRSLVSYANARTDVRLSSSVEGVITEKETGKPLSNVKVQLKPAPQFTMFTTTDEWGQFSFLKPLPGDYTLTIGANAAEIPVATQPGAHTLVVPTNAAFTVSMKAKAGKTLEPPIGRVFFSASRYKKLAFTFNPFIPPPVKIFNYSEGQIEIGLPAGTKP